MIYTHLTAAIIAALAAWFFQGYRYGEQIAEMRLATSNEVVEALRRNKATTESITTAYQGAINAARTREVVLRRDADAARAESDSLREQNAEAARRIASAPPAAVAEYARTVGELFSQCSVEYQGLARKADGHVSDVRACREAWPLNLSSKNDMR